MPSTTGGLNFTYPSEASTGWFTTIAAMYDVISAHDHTGSPNGSQLGTASIVADAITGAKIRLDNDEYLKARNNADSANIDILKIATSDALVINPATLFNAGVEITGDIQVDGGDFLDANGNELFKITSTASAVNELTLANAATGSGPTISSTGDDAAIDLNITPKGTGDLVLDGLNWPQADGSANEALVTDGAGQLSFSSISANVLQIVEASTSTKTSVSAEIPSDGTIPQNTEGAELLTLAITPLSSTSTLYIDFDPGYMFASASGMNARLALFKDSDASALTSVITDTAEANNTTLDGSLSHSVASTDTSARTYKIRGGRGTSGTLYFIQSNGGTQLFGGVESMRLRIIEAE